MLAPTCVCIFSTAIITPIVVFSLLLRPVHLLPHSFYFTILKPLSTSSYFLPRLLYLDVFIAVLFLSLLL